MSDPLAQVTAAFVDAFRPLARIAVDPTAATALFQGLGFDLEFDAGALAALDRLVPSLSRIEDDLVPMAERLTAGDELTLADGVTVATVVAELTADLSKLADEGAGALADLPSPLDDPATWGELAGAIPADLVAGWFEAAVPAIYLPLRLAGAIRTWVDGRGRRQRTVDWRVVGDLARDPIGTIRTEYGWGGDLDHVALMAAIRDLARATGTSLQWGRPEGAVAEHWFAGNTPFGVRTLRLELGHAALADGAVSGEIGVEVIPVPTTADEPIRGLAIANRSAIAADVELPIVPGWSVDLHGDVDASAALTVELFPDQPARVDSAEPAIDLGVTVRGEPTGAEPWLLFGRGDGLRLQLDGIELSAGLGGPVDALELTAGIATLREGLSLVIPTGSGDAFVSEMMGPGVEAGATFDLGWSSLHGVTLDGSVSLFTVIVIDRWIGPVHLQHLAVGLTFGPTSELELGVAFSVVVGPLTVTLDGVGLQLTAAAAADGNGDLGPFDLALDFLPPTGFGVVIDIAGVVTGGGFIRRDRESGQYSGVFEVDVLGLGLTAIAMLTTPLPGQDDGWSLFISITARFPIPIQLSFGFTLNAIGAIVGIHRRMDTDAIRAGLADGSLDAIMFPDDVVANAPMILDSLGTSFPEAHGQYVFGALLELGWLPPIVTGQLGVIIQLPDPLQIVLVGQAESVLPHQDLPLLELRCDVLGVIDLTAGTIAVDATLRDSRLVLLTLTGPLAVRASLLDDPSIMVSAGGFHPAFAAPPGFPSLQRLSVALNVPDVLDVRLEAYTAITSNTLQFGSRFSFFGKAGPITAEGGAGFDALFTLDPFGMTVGVDFGITIEVAGFDALAALLTLQVSGPSPWRFVGTATFTLCGLDKDFHLDETVGPPAAVAPLSAVAVATMVRDALGDADNWEVVAPVESGGITLRPPTGDAPGLDPGGTVQVRQQVAPLEIELDKYGQAPISGPTTIHVERARLGGRDAATTSVTDWFADGVYWELGRSERLGAPSFEQHTAGYALTATAGSTAGNGRPTLIDHDTELWEDPTLDLALEPPPPGLLDATLVVATTSKALVTTTRPTSSFALGAATYTAVSAVTGKALAEAGATFVGARRASVAAGPITVVPTSEVRP